MHGKIPAGNLLLSFAILMAGAYISKTFSVQTYRKILIISPGLLFVQRKFLVGLYFWGGDYYWKGFCTSKIVRLIFGRHFASENFKVQMGILC